MDIVSTKMPDIMNPPYSQQIGRTSDTDPGSLQGNFPAESENG